MELLPCPYMRKMQLYSCAVRKSRDQSVLHE
jgi:hypothetical protein